VLLAGLAALPDGAGLRVGAAVGGAWARLGGPRTRVARVNLRIAFPDWSEAERERVLVHSFEQLGRSLVELAQLGRRSPAQLAARVRIEGLEHLERARAQAAGGGVIVLSAHFGSWEMFAAAMSARGLPITVVHRTRDDAGLEEVLMERRLEGGATYLARGSAAFGVIKALRKGALLALLFDQNARAGDGVFVPFFGRLASAHAGPVRLAMSTGAPVLPAFLHRDPLNPGQHVVRFQPTLALAPGDDAAALLENARRMTRVIEDEIRAAPEHWVWLHRRWRTQPPGEPRPPYRLARRL
jgi:KDO2-lipid IV(A) lauroyltransferase